MLTCMHLVPVLLDVIYMIVLVVHTVCAALTMSGSVVLSCPVFWSDVLLVHMPVVPCMVLCRWRAYQQHLRIFGVSLFVAPDAFGTCFMAPLALIIGVQDTHKCIAALRVSVQASWLLRA